MKNKKSKKANLEKNRLIYFELGMILTLSVTLVAFEWSKSPSSKDSDSGRLLAQNDFEVIEQTFRKKEEIVKEKPKMTLIINKVKDDNLNLDDPYFPNPEIGADDPYELWKIPEYGNDEPIETVDFVKIEDKPLFNGGDPMVEFRKYIASKLKYPDEAAENGIEGRVTLVFIIDEHGRMTDVKVIQGVHPSLDEEAYRVISSSPSWTPGKQRGRPVRVRYYFPVIFKLSH